MKKLPDMNSHADAVHPLKTQPERQMMPPYAIVNAQARQSTWSVPLKAAANAPGKELVAEPVSQRRSPVAPPGKRK